MDSGALVGRWRLTAWTATDHTGSVTRPFGDHPDGSVIYTPGGWMSGHLSRPDRPHLSTPTALGGPEPERAQAYATYIAYCGEYRIEGDTVVHTLRMSLFPNWAGTEQRRTVDLSDDRLVLSTPPTPVGDQILVNRLHWIRVER
ncbi:lipocalin-like domain-containing protein [Nocardia otitidiscaviarum]|uniref:lipocalin-like domain-containing protein n=1 Tax=Nocardia otitidiscaviarum TaxID=1823 RepID=UPI0018958F6B|nr:lipocalin-like domain-containing protein [Nocardia otitidiscaviarum]MBF6241789.1 lipocalin-like domain-containing protein [Nocardia otitidiscaviarum]